MSDETGEQSLQERYAPASICYGCGPANPVGLRLASLPGVDGCVATWEPGPGHQAFPGVLNGGIIATLLDCHSNWTAAMHLMGGRGAERPPVTVTAELSVRLLRPTPSGGPIRLAARVVQAESDERRVVVEGRLFAADTETAVSRATFVAVGPGHPAYEAWSRPSRPDAGPAGPSAPEASSASARATSAGR
jgi:acyl-coenzyme A thioesterase PaaI-like protein